MRTLLIGFLAIATVMTMLFFGLGGDTGPSDPILTATASTATAPGDLEPVSPEAGDPDAEPTLVAVTTTIHSAPAETPSVAPLGTLPLIDDLGRPTLDASSSVSTVGIDRIMFGMTIRDAQVAAGSRFTPVTPIGHCYLVTPDDGQAGLTFWVVAGTIERVDVDTRTITTRSGAGIGDTEDRIREMFGERIHTTPLPDGSGNLLAYIPKDVADATYRVMFLSNGVQITRLWAGRLPWAEELGGCPSS